MNEPPLLSNREREVAEQLLQGLSNKLIASSLGISIRTVEFHLRNMFAKYEVSSRVELVLKLGETLGEPEEGNPVFSTVDKTAVSLNNGDSSAIPLTWRTSLRQTISIFNKEFGMTEMTELLKAQERDENPVTFQEAIRVCLIKYADFTGQASRAEFWWFTLFVSLVTTGFTYLHPNVGAVFATALFLPQLAVGARRLHDIGKSAWWLLFGLAPVGGLVVLAVWFALPPEEPAADKMLHV
ncbi:MAG: DUF805 domain-containing protein [Chloroflexi bacterium]|nr:DUF805 domain-containing protein [Chloroflexota bacterium]